MLQEGQNDKSGKEDPEIIKKLVIKVEISKTFYCVVFNVKFNITLMFNHITLIQYLCYPKKILKFLIQFFYNFNILNFTFKILNFLYGKQDSPFI